ncbi:MAG: aldehyde ferredoxin oxidoreductase [Firmicutes bacterium]|nr:aldehyde ferredoxin oxidoreductase [Bacillota bacterium]
MAAAQAVKNIGMINLKIDMTTQKIDLEPVPDDQRTLGGRGLVAAIANKEIPPGCDPLGPENKLILAPGLFARAGISSALRFSVGGKSPLTGGIRESNAGGTTARAVASLGLKSVVISGRPKPGQTFILVIRPEGAELLENPELAGLGAYQTAGALKKRFGPNTAALLIGPAGERLSLAACALNLDYQGRPSRANGRGGLGALMGSKGLKAVVVIPPAKVNLAKKATIFPELQPVVDRYCRVIKESTNTQNYHQYGTALTGDIADSIGCLPTQNFHRGSFEGKPKILGKTVRRLILERGGAGNPSHTCTPGCIVGCSNVFPDRNGKELVSPLDYEAIASIGSNLCIDDIDAIARLYWLINDLGIDVIEAGASLALLMDEGVLPWGDAGACEKALKTAYTGDYPGYLIANGLVVTAKHRGVDRIAAVKGMAFAAFDPRAIKGLGVTYATSPQGADHTAGHTIRKKIDHHQVAGQVDLSFTTQIQAAVYDTLGICFFATGALNGKEEVVVELYNLVTGEQKDFSQLEEEARRTIALEYRFNQAAGFSPADDRLPEFCYSEPLPPANITFNIDQARLAEAIKEYILS